LIEDEESLSKLFDNRSSILDMNAMKTNFIGKRAERSEKFGYKALESSFGGSRLAIPELTPLDGNSFFK
jgi:hypothetical protein